MKKIVLFSSLLFTLAVQAHTQEYCSNFKIVSVLDFPPSPQHPGGNYFLLMLAAKEDNPDISTGYADLFFLDSQGDTISIPTGPSHHLPLYQTDTIPYVLKLSSEESNQDFPSDFDGKLVIINLGHDDCEIEYANFISGLNTNEAYPELEAYPNPFRDKIFLRSGRDIQKVWVVNSSGQIVVDTTPEPGQHELRLSNLSQGGYFLIAQLEGRIRVVRPIIKI